MSDAFDRVRRTDPVDPTSLPGAPPGLAERLMTERPARRFRPTGPAVAAAAMAVVLLAGGLTTLIMRGDGEEAPIGPSSAPRPTTTEPSTLPEVTATTFQPSPTSPAGTLPAAPWSQNALTPSELPAHLIDDWTGAGNRTWCSVLYPTPSARPAGAANRSADFAGGWGIAWDVPGEPGRSVDGSYCADCGRGAFGLAGAGITGRASDVEIWPTRLGWDDGSVAGYGFEGLASPRPGEAAPPLLAYLIVERQGCLYNVWSFLGEQHLLELINSLRFVEGLQAAPVALVDWNAAEPAAMGPAPWSGPPIVDVPGVLWDEWNEDLGTTACPMVAFLDLGTAGTGAVARRANGDSALIVAWDLPDGPGRYGSGDYCADCGRGAFGTSLWLQDGFFSQTERGNPTLTYDDGSRAWIAPELNPNLPDDRIIHLDPVTGEQAPEAYRALIMVAAHPDCLYQVWSSYGPDHVEYLVSRLRYVASRQGLS